jgi:ATP/maltotriose-dependent transcriptional regulator MalT
LVTRERLHAALDLGVRSALTLLVAPAGTGKTVLLSDWVARRRQSDEPVIWIPGHAPQELEHELRRIGAADPPVPIVVDDAHLLPATTTGELARALRKSPDALRVLLASRYDLPLPVPELELRGLALTLRSGDLRFTDAEATELVRAHAHSATEADVQLFQERTAGWAAALVLAARALAASGDAVWPLVNQRPVLDLLLGETLSTLDERVRAMLLTTFGAENLTSRLAAMLSDDAEAGSMLADLAGSGLLVTEYSNSSIGAKGSDPSEGEPIYRYHPLLVELLRRRVATNRDDAGVVAAAQHRSALYYENRGDGGTALRSALGADDPALVARILLAHGPELLAAGDLGLMAAGFEALPDTDLDGYPHLIGVRGLLRRLGGDVAGAVLDAARADQAVGGSAGRRTPDDDALDADATLLHLWESRYGWHDVHAAIARARNLLTLQPADGRARAVLGAERLAWLLIELAAAETWAGDLEAALGHLDEAVVTARMAGHPQLIAGCLVHRAIVHHVRGQARSAAESAQAAFDVGGSDELPQDYGVRGCLALAFGALSELDLDTAWRWYERIAHAEVAESDTVIASLRVMLHGVLLIETGRLDDALTTLATDLATAGPLPAFLSRDLALLRWRLAVLLGDHSAAAAQVAELERTGNLPEAKVLRAVLTIDGGDPRSTAAMIDDALSAADPHPPLACAAAAFRTVLLIRSADRPAVEASVVDTLHRVAPQRLLHALIPVGHEPDFLDELRRHVAGASPHPFAPIALEKLSADAAAWRGPGGPALLPPKDANIGPPRRLEAVVNGARIRLTIREAEVLDQLALGNSYGEIGQALFITENTVKTHLMSLYRKLGVEKRSAALRVARASGLVVVRSG